MKVKIDDNVLVTTGKYKGQTGKIQKVYKKTNQVVVAKINIRTKHIKKTPQQAGQRVKYEAPFEASNVQVICPNCSKTTRVAYIVPEKGKKFRSCKKCQQSLDTGIQSKKKK